MDLMNWDTVEGNWKQFKGRVREQWGRLTNDEVDVIAGRRDKLIGKLQEHYGIAREEAERQIREWADMLEVTRP
jgi:uncharacterized protein YjbJ (UPF0337 family)